MLEFLAICSEYAALKTIKSAIQRLGGNLHCAPTLSAAAEFIERRKIDGIILDLALENSLDIVQSVRSGNSNRVAVVFACVEERQQAAAAISSGANFVFYKPLVEETLLQILQAGAPMMTIERRRYFRYPVSTPVHLSCNGIQHKAMISNLSESGMAVRTQDNFTPGATVEFSFGLPDGPAVKGKGEVIWTNTGGSVGIQFRFLADTAHRELPLWLSSQEKQLV